MKRKTQKNEILKFMENHKKGITSLEAFEHFGATRLSGIIYDLKHRDGIKIKTEYPTVKTRYGVKTVVARYSLED